MRHTNLDKVKTPEVSNAEVFTALKYLFFDRLEELNVEGFDVKDLGIKKYFLISEFIQRITDDKLLRTTEEFLKRHGFKLQPTAPLIDNLQRSQLYSDTDLIRINAHIIAMQLLFIVYSKLDKSLDAALATLKASVRPLLEKTPQLSIDVIDRVIIDNEDEALLCYRRKIAFVMKAQAESLSQSEGKIFLEKSIVAMAELDYLGTERFFSDEILFLSTLKDNLSKPAVIARKVNIEQQSNPYPRIFNQDGYILWRHIVELYVDSGHGGATDISYFYWRLRDHVQNYIMVKPEEFRAWLQKTGTVIGKIKSFSQIPKNVGRDNQFKDALDWLKSVEI